MVSDLDDLGQHDLHVVGPHASRHDREWHPAVRPSSRGDLTVGALERHLVEAPGHLRYASVIADQEHVLGQLTALKRDVVLPRAGSRGIRSR